MYPDGNEWPFVRLVAHNLKVHILEFEDPEAETLGWNVAYCGASVDDEKTAIRQAEWWLPDTCGECFRSFGEGVIRRNP